MVDRHYNIGGMLEAAHAFHADLKAQRAATRPLAQRELRKRAPTPGAVVPTRGVEQEHRGGIVRGADLDESDE